MDDIAINAFNPEQNGIFLVENHWILNKISLKFVPGPPGTNLNEIWNLLSNKSPLGIVMA